MPQPYNAALHLEFHGFIGRQASPRAYKDKARRLAGFATSIPILDQ